jgi:hypothetical protein
MKASSREEKSSAGNLLKKKSSVKMVKRNKKG